MKIEKNKLIDYIWQNKTVNIWEIVEHFGVTKMTVHRHLKNLCSNWLVTKRGGWPNTIYEITSSENMTQFLLSIPLNIRAALDNHRYQINKIWKIFWWASGFCSWCIKRNLDVSKESHKRYQYFLMTETMRLDSGCIDASKKLIWYWNDTLDGLFYQDIYAWPQYGKSKRWTLLEISKIQPTNNLLWEILFHIKPSIQKLVFSKKIDALCFIKPTMSRKLQIMTYLETNINITLPIIPLKKKPWFFPPQKSIKHKSDRIANANASFLIKNYKSIHNHVLIIDDAVWSGATLIENAKRIKESGIAKKVSWYAITGTANWIFKETTKFEVFSNT